MGKSKEYQAKYYRSHRGQKGNALSPNKQVSALLSKLDGQRGMIALDSNGNPVYASNKTDRNGSLQIKAGTWKNADSIIFTIGKKDARETVIPNAKYAETFANSSASKMTVRNEKVNYTMQKTSDFDSIGFKKKTSEVHATARKDLQRKNNIINTAYKSGKMTSDEVVAARKRANKEFADEINNFYKNKKNQKRYGFKVMHN